MIEVLRFVGFVAASMAIFIIGKDVLLNWNKDSSVESVKDDQPKTEFKDVKEPADELAKLDGISREMLPYLAKANIRTFSDLELADESDVKAAISELHSDVTMSEIKLWIRQASLAEQERWDELDKLKAAMQKARAKMN